MTFDLDEWSESRQAYDEAAYWMELGRMRTAAGVLDFLLQVNGKDWCSPQLLKDIVDELEEACRERLGTCAQGVFCPGGSARRTDWKASEFRKGKA